MALEQSSDGLQELPAEAGQAQIVSEKVSMYLLGRFWLL